MTDCQVCYNSSFCVYCSNHTLLNGQCVNLCSLPYVISSTNLTHLLNCFGNSSCPSTMTDCLICYNSTLCLYCANGSLINGSCLVIDGCASYNLTICISCKPTHVMYQGQCIDCNIYVSQDYDLDMYFWCWGTNSSCSDAVPNCFHC